MAGILTIAVDIDDVLAAHAQGFVEFSNERWGTKLTVDDYDEHFAKVWQTDQEEAERRAVEFQDPAVFGTFRHDVAAKIVLKQLSASYNLVIITSRRRVVAEATIAWIDTYFPDTFSEVRFAGMWDEQKEGRLHATKNDLCKELGAGYLIDDQLKHCFAAAEVGVIALLFGEYAWNAADTSSPNVIRVKDWTAVQEYFDGRG